ncbi:FCP1 homology domain-containing protein [uncultured Gammaproteobacteria bacterium]
MKIAFDMDNTLFDEFGREVRPGIASLLLDLKKDGHELVLWTSSTRARAHQILGWHDFAAYFSAIYCREDYDPDNKGAIKELSRFGIDAIIDDDPKHCAAAQASGHIGVQVVSFRGGTSARAEEMTAVYQKLRRHPNRLWDGLRGLFK